MKLPPNPNKDQPVGGAALIQLGPDEFLVAGSDVRISFGLASPAPGENSQFLDVEEGTFENGRWVMTRRWNGDQTDYGLNLRDADPAQGPAGDLSMKLCGLPPCSPARVRRAWRRVPADRNGHRRDARRTGPNACGCRSMATASSESPKRHARSRSAAQPDGQAKPRAGGFTRRAKGTPSSRSAPKLLGRSRHGDRQRQIPRRGGHRSRRKRARHLQPARAEGPPWLSISQQFNRGTDEGFYGLGQHQNGQMNYNGEDVVLAQHNMDVAIPFVVSTRNYGVLWDNNSVTRFGDPKPYALCRRPRRRPDGQ